MKKKTEIRKKNITEKKDILLTLASPTCIHKEIIGYERERIYDDDPRYDKHMECGDYVWHNSYWDNEVCEEVSFVDILDKDRPKYNYYLFYDFGLEHTFHSPIRESELSKYNLEIVDIDRLHTSGEMIGDLLSVQFVDKMIALIKQGNVVFN